MPGAASVRATPGRNRRDVSGYETSGSEERPVPYLEKRERETDSLTLRDFS